MQDLHCAIVRKLEESHRVQRALLEGSAERLVDCARAVRRALDEGGRLFTFGNGGSACDAAHAAVEFMHPVVEKRAAFGAQSVAVDPALLTAIGNDRDFALAFAQQLRQLARKGDVVLAFSTSGESASVNRALAVAREFGMTTVGFTGRDGGRMAAACDHCFVAPSFSIHRIQECHGLLLHLLWDLVHLDRGEEDVL